MNHAKAHLIGIDIGTTSTKVLIINSAGAMVIGSSMPATLASPHAGWAEEDAAQWWENVRQIIPRVLREARLEPTQIGAIGVSGMVPTLVLLDEQGELLRASIQQNDARAIKEIAYQKTKTEESAILRQTGSLITQQSIGPKLLWVQSNEPDRFTRIRHIMGSYDYIAFRLTGHFSVERNWALESGLYDLGTADWDDSLLKLAAVNRSLFGAIHWPSEIIGSVSEIAARECGLVAGIPVVGGSADHIASAFSAGVSTPGDLLIKLGGAGDILYCADSPSTDRRLYLDYHVVPERFLINGCMASSGSLIRWFREQFSPTDDYRVLDDAAESLPAGSDGLVLLPYFLGEKTPLNDPHARGTVIGLTLSHTKAHLYRAVLEGIAFGFNHHLRVLAEHGRLPQRARLTNGGAHSMLWRKITADVTGLPLEGVANHPGSSLGAAFVAGKGVGIFESWDEIERFITVGSVTQPDRRNHERYQRVFEVYLQAYESLRELYPRLSESVSGGEGIA